MLLSVANTSPRNIESVRARDILPESLQANATSLIELLEEYYEFLNSGDMPSREIASIQTQYDIDLISTKYLNQIQDLIGKSVPNSRVINKIDLYKIIVRYYNSRGSEDSIHSFFKIFFDEFVSIFYPKEFLFNLSRGNGSWSGESLIQEDALIRQISDVSSINIDGITYTAKSNDGSGQLISIRYAESIDAYDIIVDYYKGVTTITPGDKSRIVVDATDLYDGLHTYEIPEHYYFSHFGIDQRPVYSSQFPFNGIPFDGNPSRIEWDGARWIFTIGSSLGGDLYAFYSDEDVADPSLVTSWIGGWESSTIIPISGSIDDVSFGEVVNGQIFSALSNDVSFSEDVLISTNILAAEWLDEYNVSSSREYLTQNPLPISGLDVGHLAVVNGRKIRPFVFGITSYVNDEFVWHKHFTEEWIYSTTHSFLSDNYKIQDGRYWQDYSYVIKCDLDSSQWHNEYYKFIHPAGLKMFTAIAIVAIARNEWLEDLDYLSSDVNEDFSWLQALVPPENGFHSPRSQPGYIRDSVFRYIFRYLLSEIHDTMLLHEVFINYKLFYGAHDVRTSFVRKQYQGSEKFIDTCLLNEGWLDKTIGDAIEAFSDTNQCKIFNLGMFIKYKNIFDYSYYDPELGEGDAEWQSSSYDTEGGSGGGDWQSSSYENL